MPRKRQRAYLCNVHTTQRVRINMRLQHSVFVWYMPIPVVRPCAIFESPSRSPERISATFATMCANMALFVGWSVGAGSGRPDRYRVDPHYQLTMDPHLTQCRQSFAPQWHSGRDAECLYGRKPSWSSIAQEQATCTHFPYKQHFTTYRAVWHVHCVEM